MSRPTVVIGFVLFAGAMAQSLTGSGPGSGGAAVPAAATGAATTIRPGALVPCELTHSGVPPGVTDSALCLPAVAGPGGDRPWGYLSLNLAATAANGGGDKVGAYLRTVSAGGGAALWSLNTVLDILPRGAGQARPASLASYELDLNNADCDAGPDPAGVPVPGCPGWSKGVWVTGLTGAGFRPVTDGVLVTGTGPGPLYHNGMRFLGPYVSGTTIFDGTDSARSLEVAGRHVDGVDLSRALFSGGAVRLANQQKVCFQADCQTFAVYDGPAGGVTVVSRGTVVALFRPDAMVVAPALQAQGSFSAGGAVSLEGQYLRVPNLPAADPRVKDALWEDPACGCLRRSKGP